MTDHTGALNDLRAKLLSDYQDYVRECGKVPLVTWLVEAIRTREARIEALERVRRAADRAMCFLMDRKPNIWHLFDGRPYVPADERELMHLLFVLNGELALTHPAALAAGEESE